jgi:universal stress protein A
MPTLQRILHATDFSKQSASAANYGSLLTRLCDAELHLLYVVEDAMGKIPEPALGFPAPGDRANVQQEVWPRLKEVVGIDLADSDRIILATRLGPISDQIVSYASDNEIDMIVIGTHGRRGVMHALLGSVAEAVVRKASCPVLTVRPGKREQDRAGAAV